MWFAKQRQPNLERKEADKLDRFHSMPPIRQRASCANGCYSEPEGTDPWLLRKLLDQLAGISSMCRKMERGGRTVLVFAVVFDTVLVVDRRQFLCRNVLGGGVAKLAPWYLIFRLKSACTVSQYVVWPHQICNIYGFQSSSTCIARFAIPYLCHCRHTFVQYSSCLTEFVTD